MRRRVGPTHAGAEKRRRRARGPVAPAAHAIRFRYRPHAAGRKLAAVVAVAGLVAVVPAAFSADATPITGAPTSPLTNIDISPDLNCTVNYTLDTSDEWFTDNSGVDACGTFVAIPRIDRSPAVYGPANVPGSNFDINFTTAPNYQAYTVPTDPNGKPNNQVTGGSGTQADPYTITTTVQLGGTGLKLVETDSYVNGQNSYRTDVQLINTGADLTFQPIIYRAGDCFMQNQDNGLGSVQNGNAPICNGAPTVLAAAALRANTTTGLHRLAAAAAPDPTTRIEGMYPIGSGSNYFEGYVGCLWQNVISGGSLPDVVDGGAVTGPIDGPVDCSSQDPMGNPYDNAVGLSWPATLAPGDSATVSALNVFSPGGAAPLTVTKTADHANATVGGPDGYTITISNPGEQAETLQDITDDLPTGFSYVTGSASGTTTDNPGVSGQQLDWHGPFVVPAASGGTAGTITLHFGVTVGNATGVFTNSASASGQDLTVNPAQNVAPVTVAPKAVDDGTYTTPYETAKTVNAASGLLANDLPNDGTTTVVTGSVTNPAHGTVAVNSDGSFTYTPNSGYSGPDSFTYHDVSHGIASNTATVALTVQRPPAPVAVNDTYSTPYETQLTVTSANGLLKNDTSSAPDQTLSVDLATVSNPVHGTVSVNADGSFTYTPNTGFAGMDTFTYKDVSAGQQSNQASVTITVGPSPAPVARDDSYSTPYETVLTVGNGTGLLVNDTPAKDQTTTVDTSTVTLPSHGTVTVNGDGSFTYTPNNGYTGPDSFTYRDIANTVQSNLATVSITVGQFPAPVAVNDDYNTPFGTPLIVGSGSGLLQNDNGPKDQTLTVDTGTVTAPAHGTVNVNPDGSFTYTPNGGFSGTDTFTYKDVAGGVQSNQATVTVTVGRDLRPIAVDDGPYAVNRNGTRTLAAPGVLANDSNPSGDPLTAVLETSPAHGAVTLHADGSFVYTPTAGYDGPDSFTYKASSGGRLSATAATVSFNVVDQAPTAASDSYPTQQDTVLNVPAATGVLANDTDPNHDPLTATLVSPASHGAVTLNSDGSFRYSPAAGFTGTDSFTYTASDGTLSSNTATVSIDVTAPPVTAADDSYQVNKNGTLQVAAAQGVLANDSPQDGSLSAQLDQSPSHGNVTLNPDGSFTYTPDHGFSGTDTFTYVATSGETSSDPATVTIQVVDQAPVAAPDSYTTAQDTTLTVPAAGVLINDTDPNGDALSAALVTAANHGAVTLNANGSFVYSPPAGFHGTATFTYRASDGTLSSTTTTVTIRVTRVVPPPPPTSSTSSTAPPPPVSTTPEGPVIVPPIEPTTPLDTFPVTPTSSSATTPTTPPPTTSTAPPPPSHSTLKLSSPSVNPGGQLTASGHGCAPNSTVLVSVNGQPAGHGTADGSGSFSIPASAPNLAVGNYTVVATCGNRQLTTEVALVSITGTSATPAARSLTVASLLAFFILLLGLIVRRPTGR